MFQVPAVPGSKLKAGAACPFSLEHGTWNCWNLELPTMPMSPYRLVCYAVGCEASAEYKIAAKWSDGTTAELKTYGLTCEACLTGEVARAIAKRSACRLAVGETLDAPGVYELHHGGRDRALLRRPDLEAKLCPS